MAGRNGGFRHLIYFIDGTWLWPASDNTLDVYSNIYLMNTLLNADDDDGQAQIVHYSRGLGAVDGIRKYTAGGFGYGIDELVADLYVNVCSNYQKGDKIYIFGFSRGAVVARALSGLLSKGILEAQHVNMFAHVWGDYIGTNEVSLPGLPEGAPNPKQPIGKYKEKCSDTDPPIEFVGVFDTVVGGHGPAKVAQRLRLKEGRVPANVKNAVQILAIDEKRSFFKPVLWTGKLNNETHLEQIWMPGVHTDIGGGYSSRFLGNISLLTMIDRVLDRTSLSFDVKLCREYNNAPSASDLVRVHDEYSKLWRLFSPIPRPRSVGTYDETIHPFGKWLEGQAVKYKRKRRQHVYALQSAFSGIKAANEFVSGKFDSFIPRAPTKSRRG